MSGRRQFGSVRKLPSGRWQARYRLPGGQRVAAPTHFASKGDASRWLASVEAGLAKGGWIDPAAGKVRLSEFADEWLQGRVNISKRTREIYALQLRLHILPAVGEDVRPLGDVPLASLTPALIRSWYAALATSRSPSTAAKAYVRLRQMLSQAVDDDRLPRNPCRLDRGGAERHTEQRFATMAELYELAAAVPERYRALVLTAGFTGLRQGELFALRRGDLDLRVGTVTVRRKRLRLASGEVIEDAPKSDAGRRTVALPAPLVTELERHLGQFAGAAVEGYVFTTPEGLPIERNTSATGSGCLRHGKRVSSGSGGTTFGTLPGPSLPALGPPQRS